MFNKETFVITSIVFLESMIICFYQLHPAYQLHLTSWCSWLMLNLEAAHNIGTIKNGVTWTLTDPPLDPACPNLLFKIFVSPPLFSLPPLLRYCRPFTPPSRSTQIHSALIRPTNEPFLV